MSCNYCSSREETIQSLRRELEARNHQLERLELDLLTLNQKYVAEIERVGNIQHEKDLVEHELEDLSRKLFEEANSMVSIEKRARYQVENELRQTKEYLLQEKNQLFELRQKLTLADDLTEFELKRASANHIMNYNNNNNIIINKKALSMPPPPPPPPTQQQTLSSYSVKTIDQVQLESFREYTVASSKKLLPVKKLNQTNFMKHCITEDIEPCLRFGSQSKLSVKKMMDFLSKQPCFIEHHTSHQSNIKQQQAYKPIWERFSSSSSNNDNNNNNIIISNSCSACGRSTLLNYRFKLDEKDNWLPIDQYCRDRLVAVCDFFVFIRNIQLGLYSDRTIEDLYTENIRLKLHMFYSRMGALPLTIDNIESDEDDEQGPATPEPC